MLESGLDTTRFPASKWRMSASVLFGGLGASGSTYRFSCLRIIGKDFNHQDNKFGGSGTTTSSPLDGERGYHSSA